MKSTKGKAFSYWLDDQYNINSAESPLLVQQSIEQTLDQTFDYQS